MNAETPDRYVTFLGIACDTNAERLFQMLHARMRDNPSRWVAYFTTKIAENEKMGHDRLRLIGAQVNALMAFFEEEEDEDALALLWHIEHHCL